MNGEDKVTECVHDWVFHRGDDYGTTQYICTKCRMLKNEKDEDQIIQYVAGFLFNPTMDQVVLIKKNRPDWQKGFYNGVGGHIELGEDSCSAMRREFHEETGLNSDNYILLDIVSSDWMNFCEISGKMWKCYFFYAVSADYWKVETKTDEQIEIVYVQDLWDIPVIENLRWLIPMCVDKSHKYCKSESKQI